MEKLLKTLIEEVKNQTREIEKFKKETINYLAFQAQIQKQTLTNIINILAKLNKEDNNRGKH